MNALIEVAIILKRITPPQFPKEIQEITNETDQPEVAPTVAPKNLLNLPADKVTEPRVNVTDTLITPFILPSNYTK